jgi:hypothetical protein
MYVRIVKPALSKPNECKPADQSLGQQLIACIGSIELYVFNAPDHMLCRPSSSATAIAIDFVISVLNLTIVQHHKDGLDVPVSSSVSSYKNA